MATTWTSGGSKAIEPKSAKEKRKVQQPMEKKEKENEIKLPTKTDSVNWPSENTKILCNLKKVLGL